MRLDPVERTFLTLEEYERLLEIINNPTEPSPALLAAARRYKDRFKDETETKERT
jgi:uncharacterized protein (DUF1778 family)